MIDGCGTRFNMYIDQELLDLIFCSLNHTNRFVRETGYYVCGALVSCNSPTGEKQLFSSRESTFIIYFYVNDICVFTSLVTQYNIPLTLQARKDVRTNPEPILYLFRAKPILNQSYGLIRWATVWLWFTYVRTYPFTFWFSRTNPESKMPAG